MKILPYLPAVFAALATYGCSASLPSWGDACNDPKINEVQQIGSHNSYHRRSPESVLAYLEAQRPGLRQKLEYRHPDLDVQLDLGLRLLEIDLFADPEGGRYAHPRNLALLSPSDRKPFPDGALDRPGFKVIHIQDYDNYSSCLVFEECLTVIKRWSDAHPEHKLVTITINVKESTPDLPGLTQALPFTVERLDEVDAAIRSVFPLERLLTPDDVRGERATLREAVVRGGWPHLSQTRQRFMFVLDADTPDPADRYRAGHPSLRGRVMFSQFDAQSDEAAFMNYWWLEGKEKEIAERVAQGFLVRTAADIGTREARAGDYRRLQASIASGAQYIATDFYPGNIEELGTTYVASFPGGKLMRCRAGP